MARWGPAAAAAGVRLALLVAALFAEAAAAVAAGALEGVPNETGSSKEFTSSGRALAVGFAVLTALWFFLAPSKQKDNSVGGTDTPERLRVLSRYVKQQIQDNKPTAHRQLLDDVIFTFSAYAERLKKGSRGRSGARSADLQRLAVLAELLETPLVNRALRAVNWAWLREWDARLLEPREARLRCTFVLPIIVCAAEVQRSQRLPHSDPGSPGLAYIACWCTDFLDRTDVRAFLGVPAAPGAPSMLVSGTGFMTPAILPAGAVASDDSESDDENSKKSWRSWCGIAPRFCIGSSGTGAVISGDSSDDEDRRSCADAYDESPAFSSCMRVSEPEELPSDGFSEGGFCDMERRRYEGQEHCWDLADATEAMVRGRDYLEDHKKVPSNREMLELVDVDLLKASEEVVHYAASSVGRTQRLRQAGDKRFYFIVNFRLHPIHFAITWAVPKRADWLSKPEGVLFRRFLAMSVEERNLRVKVLPKVLQGPWLVKKGMPDRPGVVGKKLALKYFEDDNHLEVSIDCVSSPTGRRLVNLLTGAARHFSMEIFIILEGQLPDELPERILSGVAVFRGDLSKIRVR